MPLPIDLWLIHPEAEMCSAFEARFRGLPNVSVKQSLFQDLPPHDCFVTAGNSFGIMNAGIDAAVIQFHGEGLMKRIQDRILNEFLGEQPIGTCIIEPTATQDYPFVAHAPTMRVPGSIAGSDKVYSATLAALVAVYRAKAELKLPINTVVFPAMGAGFGNVPFDEVARQMSVAYMHYLDPPHRLYDWDMVIARHKRISYDGVKQVVTH
jgi:O-acetyl-ADP-ribose deacetylase (regulator of RNase III)